MDWSIIAGGILCIWIFLLMLSHERQQRVQAVDAEWAAEQQRRADQAANAAAIQAAAERRKAQSSIPYLARNEGPGAGGKTTPPTPPAKPAAR